MRITEGLSRRAPPSSRSEEVAHIIETVRAGGDRAVLELTERFDHAELGPEDLRVDPRELEVSVGIPEPALLEALRTAIANVRAVAEAQLGEPVAVVGLQGQRIEVSEVPVGRAAIYVPGGRAPYLSTVVMGAVTARVAGVRSLAVCAPPARAARPTPRSWPPASCAR